MFALGIHYLNGWAMAAADGAQKEQAEWPPHPDRVFMALAAAWFETGENPAEGNALRWLETLDPPAISASAYTTRTPVTSYVPINDESSPLDKKSQRAWVGTSLPIGRNRQPRGFPVAIPHDPTVYLVWADAAMGEHRAGLERLAAKVTHVGHSASLVQAWVEDDGDAAPRWAPTEGAAAHRLRVPTAGRLDQLIRDYNRDAILEYAGLRAQLDALGQEKSNAARQERRRLNGVIAERFGKHAPVSARPRPGRWQGYDQHREPERTAAPSSVFDSQLTVLAIKGWQPSLEATLKLTQALRGALMDVCPVQPPPEWFSGHKLEGLPTDEPHMALIPLPFVGDSHADGRVMGLAVALPRETDPMEAIGCLEPLQRDERGLPWRRQLFDGQWFECAIELETRERPPKNLDDHTWTRESQVWASVTPVVLDRHFKGEDKWAQAAESVKDACQRIGLPRPVEVVLHAVSPVEGVPHARDFPQAVRKSDGGRRSHTHAVIVFDEPVRGPVLVGAGRYRGYGLCRPLDQRGSDHD